MKTIGLIGGMSWESTVTYYALINEAVKEELGGLHSAKILMYSVDFAEIEDCQSKGEWERSGEILGDAARRLELAGADLILVCTNTMHKVVPQIKKQIGIPLLHIAEALAAELKWQKVNKVLLLGTKYTMTQDFYKEKLIDGGINVLIPDLTDMEIINDIIFNELCLGRIEEKSRQLFRQIIRKFPPGEIEGVVLGCTEIGLLVKQEDYILQLFDTTYIHAAEAVRVSLG